MSITNSVQGERANTNTNPFYQREKGQIQIQILFYKREKEQIQIQILFIRGRKGKAQDVKVKLERSRQSAR